MYKPILVLKRVAAGTIAGLSVERIINEPTAAAIAYAHLRWNADLAFVNSVQ
jgi:hypothetical protein